MGNADETTNPTGDETVDGTTPGEPTSQATIDHADGSKDAAQTDDETGAPTPVVELSVEQEVEARSADTHEPQTEYRKAFVIGPHFTKLGDDEHDANKAATRQYAIAAGLHPTGDVRHISTRKHADKVSTVITYGVEVAVAHRLDDEVVTPEVTGDDGDPDKAANAQTA